MTRHLVITLAAAVVAFGLILGARRLLTHDPPAPWLTDEATAFARARAQHKGVLLDFRASWSVPSAEVSRSLDELVRVIDRDFIRLRIDVSDGDDAPDAPRARYGVTTIPAVVLVSTDGRELGRIVQVTSTARLREAIAAAVR